MPMYTWRDQITGKQLDVVRSFSEYEIIPTAEEAGMSDEDYTRAAWERVIAGGQQIVKGPSWGPGKGSW